jgi:formate dehydrogenase beta subunit
MLALLERDEWDADTLRRLAQVMQDASICGLGQAAPNPVLGLLADFREPLARQGVTIIEGGSR